MFLSYQAPLTRVVWWNLAEWVDAAHALEGRKASPGKNHQRIVHIRALPLRMVWEEGSLETLQAALDLLTDGSGFRQPSHTLLICAIKNRMKRLEHDREFIPDSHSVLSMHCSMMMGL